MKRHGWLLAASTVALGLGLAPRLWADLAPGRNEGPRESHEERLRHRLESLREQAASLASAPRPLLSSAPLPSGSGAAPSNSAATPSGSVVEELARKWAKLVATRHERRERHRADVARELGSRLSDPAILAEVKIHATRQAELERAKFLAQNARRGSDRDKILARIVRLSQREATRHRARMEKLLGRSGAGADSAASTAVPPPAPSAGGPR